MRESQKHLVPIEIIHKADTFAAEPAQHLGNLVTGSSTALRASIGDGFGHCRISSVVLRSPALTMEWNFAHSCTCLHTPARVCTLLHDGAASGIELTSEDYFALP
jgi:hypothetical protein